MVPFYMRSVREQILQEVPLTQFKQARMQNFLRMIFGWIEPIHEYGVDVIFSTMSITFMFTYLQLQKQRREHIEVYTTLMLVW